MLANLVNSKECLMFNVLVVIIVVVKQPFVFVCPCSNISYHEIFCETDAAGAVLSGSVRLSIDHASVLGVYPFRFMEDPQFNLLEPQYTIPS